MQDRTDLSRRRRRARAFQELQGGRGGVWTETLHVSIGRERPDGWPLEMRGWHAAYRAVRSGTEHADPHHQVVVAQGLGHEDRPTSGNEAGDRRRGTANGSYHA